VTDRLPAATGPEERDLIGPRLQTPQAYLRALLASSWRREVLMEDILSELRARGLNAGAPPAEPAPVAPKPAKGKTPTP
jgi:hypothetical protein